MGLRARLIIAMVCLLMVGLVTAGLATLGALHRLQLNNADTQLDQLGGAVPPGIMDFPARAADSAAAQAARNGQPFVILQVRSPDGTVRLDLGAPAVRSAKIVVRPHAPTSGDPGGAVYRSVTLPGAHPDLWRVRASWFDANHDILVVGLPLSAFGGATKQLVTVEAVVIGLVLVAITLVALWVIRFGLRPLENIAEVATAIGAGDLDRRIDPHKPGTEIGRLSDALNAMLIQVQTAFDERLASEDRLRRFVADASHELNTPIATIRGYAELFRHGAAGDPQQLALAMSRIESEATRMGQLVSELLLLAKLDADRALERNPVDPARLAAEAAADARAIEPDRPITVRADEGVIMIGDEPRLRQLLTNLLSNVREHTPHGTPAEIRVRGEGDDVLIEVADAGPGIPADHAERIFERFYRRPGPVRSRGGSSGLGLAIVASIAEAHGGAVSVSPRPGEGAVFVVRLPRAPA